MPPFLCSIIYPSRLSPWIPVDCHFEIIYCCNSVVLSWVNKVATRTQSFEYAITNLHAPVELILTQSADNIRFISQLKRCFKSPPKVIQVFQWHSYFNILDITSSRGSSSYSCFELECLRIWYLIICNNFEVLYFADVVNESTQFLNATAFLFFFKLGFTTYKTG